MKAGELSRLTSSIGWKGKKIRGATTGNPILRRKFHLVTTYILFSSRSDAAAANDLRSLTKQHLFAAATRRGESFLSESFRTSMKQVFR